MKLGPGLLQKTDPQLAVLARGECYSAVWFAGKVVIDNHWRFFSIYEESHLVNSRGIDLLRYNHGSETLWKLCLRAQRRQEVAVS